VLAESGFGLRAEGPASPAEREEIDQRSVSTDKQCSGRCKPTSGDNLHSTITLQGSPIGPLQEIIHKRLAAILGPLCSLGPVTVLR
jgi:hypothetical protein